MEDSQVRTKFWVVAYALLGLAVATISFPILVNSISIVVLALAIIVLAIREGIPRPWHQNKIYVLLVLLYLVWLASSLFSGNFADLDRIGVQKLSLLVFPFAFLVLQPTRKHLNELGLFFLCGTLLVSLVLYGNAFYAILFDRFVLKHLFSWWFQGVRFVDWWPIQTGYLAYCNVIAIGIAAGRLLERPGRRRGIFLIFSICVLVLSTIQLGSRMAILALFLALVVTVSVSFIFSRSIKLLIGGLLITALALGSLSQFSTLVLRLKNGLGTQTTMGSDGKAASNIGSRLALVEAGIAVWSEKPILGQGHTNGKKELLDYYEEHNMIWAQDHRYNVHNQYLQQAVESGILGFLALFLLFIIAIIGAIREKNLLAIFALVAFGFFLLTECVLNRHWGLVLFAFCMAYLGSLLYDQRQNE
ncbi:MAG: O-antigen ligase family protein, partial [Bacteroidota bacterium]